METADLQVSNEEKFRDDLVTYLQGKDLVDSMLPDAPDIEEKWTGIAEAYLPDGTKEFAAYPTVSLGWMMYVGMAVAKYWDEDWSIYNKVENHTIPRQISSQMPLLYPLLRLFYSCCLS